MGLSEQLNSDLRDAIKSGDRVRVQTLRGLKSAIKYAEIEAGTTLDDESIMVVIVKEAKQRRDSMAEFKKGRRDDLVEQEAAELAILERYLPVQLSADEIEARAKAIVAELGVTDMKGMGPVMGRLMTDLKGQADGKLVNQIVRQLLSSSTMSH